MIPTELDYTEVASLNIERRINMIGVGINPLDMAQAVAALDRWREEG